jgi:hypothetical protein
LWRFGNIVPFRLAYHAIGVVTNSNAADFDYKSKPARDVIFCSFCANCSLSASGFEKPKFNYNTKGNG